MFKGKELKVEFGKGERKHEDRQSYFTYNLGDNVMSATRMDTMHGIAGIVVMNVMVRTLLWKREEEEVVVVVVKDITIADQQDTLGQVLQVEEATEGEEAIAEIMREERTIEEKKKRTLIPETIDSHESAQDNLITTI